MTREQAIAKVLETVEGQELYNKYVSEGGK
jgi:hypothetical protein